MRATASDFPNSMGHYSGSFTSFDILGRAVLQTNPTEMNSTWTASGDDNAGWYSSAQTYDWKGRPLRTTNTDGTYKEASYGGCGCAGGEVVTLKDEGTMIDGVLKRRTQRIYSDPLGRTSKSEVLNWDGSVYSTTANTYNARDQVTLVRQFQGADTSNVYQDTTLTFDGYGRLLTRHVPQQNAGTATTYSYNNDDTTNTVTDARGVTATFGYNARHLLTSVSYPPSLPAGVAPTANVSFDYDQAGNRTSMTDALGRVDYEYDQLSRLNTETRQFVDSIPQAPLANNGFRISYEYSLAGKNKWLIMASGFHTNTASPGRTKRE